MSEPDESKLVSENDETDVWFRAHWLKFIIIGELCCGLVFLIIPIFGFILGLLLLVVVFLALLIRHFERAKYEPKKRSVQTHLSTLITITLVSGAFIILTLHSRWSSGIVHIGFPIDEAFTDHYPWIDDWGAFLIDMVVFYAALRASAFLCEYLFGRRGDKH